MANRNGHVTSVSEPGIKADGQLLHSMRREVASLLGRPQTGFPGAQPVSFMRQHLDELMKQDYYLCEKSDGIRYLMYSTEDEAGGEVHYLIDRKNDYWFVNNKNLHLPMRDNQQAFHTNTLLDGELVMDQVGPDEFEPKFLVFDCLVMDGENLMQKTLDKRLGRFHEMILNPYKALFRLYPEERPFQPFFLEQKNMQLGYGIEAVFHEIQSLKHGNDGLIFTCRNTPYKHGTDPHIIKWKPADENTIDCQLRLRFPTVQPDEVDLEEGWTEPYVDYEGVPRSEIWTYMGDSGPNPYQFFADVHVTGDEWERLKGLGDPLQERIVECYRDDEGRWRVMRFRDDKSHPNHFTIIRSILESIEDGVSEKELTEAAKAIKENWKLREKGQAQLARPGGGERRPA